MKNREVSPKALTTWVVCGMLGPLALTASRSGWVAVLLTGVLCTALCVTIHIFSDSHPWDSRLYSGILCLWHIYAAAVVAAQSPLCWPGKGADIAVPLVLLALAALSAWKGAEGASRVAAVLCPLCVLIFAVILACGIGNIRWGRVGMESSAPSGNLIFVFLLPIGATAIPRKPGIGILGCMTGLSIFAWIVSAVSVGTLSLPISLTRKDAFYEVSKSLSLFGKLQRLEAISAVAVTVSIYAMLSLLLSSVGHLAENVRPGFGRAAVAGGAGICAAIVAGRIFVSANVLVVLALLIWGVCPLVASLFPTGKKEKKDEKTP